FTLCNGIPLFQGSNIITTHSSQNGTTEDDTNTISVIGTILAETQTTSMVIVQTTASQTRVTTMQSVYDIVTGAQTFNLHTHIVQDQPPAPLSSTGTSKVDSVGTTPTFQYIVHMVPLPPPPSLCRASLPVIFNQGPTATHGGGAWANLTYSTYNPFG